MRRHPDEKQVTHYILAGRGRDREVRDPAG
jgi:hypothetical protein